MLAMPSSLSQAGETVCAIKFAKVLPHSNKIGYDSSLIDLMANPLALQTKEPKRCHAC
jgi:hypothetical protein